MHHLGKFKAIFLGCTFKGKHITPNDPHHHNKVGDKSGHESRDPVLSIGNKDGTGGPDNTDEDVAGEGVGGGLEGFLIFRKVNDGEFGGHFDGTNGGLDTGKKDGFS